MGYSLTKIAQELGLSKATISLVLSGKAHHARISEELEQKIKKFCEKVNYVPNIHAQRINQKYVKTIGFLINRSVKIDIDNPFADSNISGITGGIVLAAEAVDYRVSIQLYNPEMNENKVFDWLRNHEIDGLIYYGLNIPDEWRKTFIEEKRHVVGIGIEPDSKIASVNVDNFDASAKLTKYLIKQGRKDFLYVAGIQDSYVAIERQNGFLTALKEYSFNMIVDNFIVADYSEAIAEEKMFKAVPDVDAIVCSNDDMAIGVLKALKRHNIDVPKQIAVVGADNINIGEYFCPSLTTFDNKPKELGEVAFKTLIKMIKGGKPKNTVIPSELIIRESSK